MMRLKNILLDAARQSASEKAMADRVMADGAPAKVAADFGLTANAVYQIKNRVVAKVKRITEENPFNG